MTPPEDPASLSSTSHAPAAGGLAGVPSSGVPADRMRVTRGGIWQLWTGRARNVYVVYAAVAAFFLVGRFANHAYGTSAFYVNAVTLGLFVVVAGFGQTTTMLAGGFDLSIPGVITLTGILLMGFTGLSGSGAIWAIPLVLLVGAAVGLGNGVGIVALKINPIVMTLATNTILGGVVLAYTQGTPVGSVPSVIKGLTQGTVAGIPNTLLLFVAFGVAGVIILNFTSFGRRLYAVGSSPRAATLAGVSVPQVTIFAYMLSGLAAAFAGILLSGYANSAFLGMGEPYLMLSLAAAVVGGISVRGGRGYFAGTTGAALILMIVTGVLASTTLPEAVRDIVLGGIIISVVVIARQDVG